MRSLPIAKMNFLVHILCTLSIAALPCWAKTPQEIQADLSGQLSSGSETILTGNGTYSTDFTQRWTIYFEAEPTYSVAAKPATIEDVQAIVQYAARNNVSFMATGGGHGYSTTLSGVQDALDVDLGNFKSVSVDAYANTMTVGGATIFADIYDPLYNAGKQIPTGGSSSPGIVGVTLGGGIGPLTGTHGLLIDSLLSVEMVTGEGQILTVSAEQNSPLFWGIRGAGFNFGIVTSATYRVYDALNDGNVYNADLLFPGEANGTIFEILSTYQGTQDDKLAISIASSLRNNTPSIGVSAIYFGTREEGEAAIKPFLDVGPTTSAISEVPYNKLVYTANFGADTFARTKGVQADIWGYNVNNLTVPTLVSVYTELMDFLLDNPSLSSSGFWLLEKFGLGVTASIDDESTAYPWRNTVSYGFFEFNLPDASPQTASTVATFAKQLRSNLTRGCGNPGGNVYVNYARGDETPEQLYGKRKLSKLRSLKRRYDPRSLFNHYNAIR